MTEMKAAAALIQGKFDEKLLAEQSIALRHKIKDAPVTLGLIFMSPEYFEVAEEVLEIFRLNAHVPLVAGCSGQGLVGTGLETEGAPGISLLLLSLPDTKVTAFRFTQNDIDGINAPEDWTGATRIGKSATQSWLAFADPFTVDATRWLQQWNDAYPHIPVLGGLASGNFDQQQTQIYLDGHVYTDGGLALSFEGGIEVHSVVSQGCRPIGDPWVVTKADKNIIFQLGSRPAYEVLAETINLLPEPIKNRLGGNLFVGLVTNEYQEKFQRGDFLVRHLLGADQDSGALAIGALIHSGQTIQFQLRDSDAADEDIQHLLKKKKADLKQKAIVGGVLCCCNGRGKSLFGSESHDAGAIEAVLGDFPLGGFFCNGEIGPIGNTNYIHGYTASLTLFVKNQLS
ncbi:MAG: FIST N-terminal domain-containing protein [Verrucomicrobiota bacterium]|nr:FIST N-terminal domain-containing protein [Verrucomicrobiota bacterium]